VSEPAARLGATGGAGADLAARRGAARAGVSPLPGTGAATVVLIGAAAAVAVAVAWVLGGAHRRPRRLGRRS
jgi:hypothetical protein